MINDNSTQIKLLFTCNKLLLKFTPEGKDLEQYFEFARFASSEKCFELLVERQVLLAFL